MIIFPKIGEILSQLQIMEEYQCSLYRGMVWSSKLNMLILVSNHTKQFYEDVWQDNILYYTGEGQTGDQDLQSGQNRRLANSRDSDFPVLLFEVFTPNQYIYRGLVKLIEDPYMIDQKSIDKSIRKVCIFPLKLIDENSFLDTQVLEENLQRKRKETSKRVKRLSIDELKNLAQQYESINVSKRRTITESFDRNQIVSEYVKKRANGKCELCNQMAPFFTLANEPYLETHHIVWLSKSGSDTINNTVALCPNCHRKMHILSCIEDLEKLLGIVRG